MKRIGKKLGKPTLLTSRNVARCVSGRKLNVLGELARYVSFVGETKKAVVLVLKKNKNITNLFGTDGIALIDLWYLPINSFCNQVNTVTTSNITATEKFKTELKRKFPEVFRKVLGSVQKQRRNLKLNKMYLLWP